MVPGSRVTRPIADHHSSLCLPPGSIRLPLPAVRLGFPLESSSGSRPESATDSAARGGRFRHRSATRTGPLPPQRVGRQFDPFVSLLPGRGWKPMRHLDQIRHTLRESFYGILKLTESHSNANRQVFPFHESKWRRSKSDPLDPINELSFGVLSVISNHRPLIIRPPSTSRSRRAASFTRAASNESFSQRGPPRSGRAIWCTTATLKVIQFKDEVDHI